MPARALFIDIDDTLCQQRLDAAGLPPPFRGQNLLRVMIDYSIKNKHILRSEAERTISQICDTVSWWHWTDFLRALDLDAAEFWDYAYEQERHTLGPVEPDLGSHLHALANAGWQLFITSNNPSSGICHKLRLAGVANIWGSPLFRQYLSPCDIHYMKSSPEFWRRCLCHTGLPATAVTIIGDNPHDDVAAPREAGISSAILYAPRRKTEKMPADLQIAANWAEIVNILQRGHPPAALET